MIEIVFHEPKVQQGALPVLARERYLKLKGESIGWILNNEAVLPFIIDRRAIFKRMVFTTEVFSIKTGDFIPDSKIFWDEVIAYIKKQNLADFISKAQSNVVFKTAPEDSVVAPWGTYEVKLDKDDEELMASFHGKHRNVIRKALKDGVKIRLESDPKPIYEMVKATVSRQNVPYFPTLSYLSGLVEELPNSSFFMVAELEGVTQGCAVILHDNSRGYYMYGGSILKPYPGSLNLLQYEVMRFLRGKGVSSYDLVGARINVVPGSKQEGIQNFKMRFGATLRTGVSFRYVFNPIRYFLFDITASVFLKLKGMHYQDPIDQLNRELK